MSNFEEIYPQYQMPGAQGSFGALVEYVGVEAYPCFSGRSALAAGLSAAGLNRMDEILVPPYLGHCVLSAISRTAFPSMTVSARTRAILVFHQFGYPQNMDVILDHASRNNWLVVNDCATALYSSCGGTPVYDYGDMSIISLSKFFNCGMGGAVLSENDDLIARLCWQYGQEQADQAFEEYLQIADGSYGDLTSLQVNGLYGYLPLIGPMARKGQDALPSSVESYALDRERRKKLYLSVREMLGERVPDAGDSVPFAMPVAGDVDQLQQVVAAGREKYGVDAPVLHFDFAQNMMSPDYRPALVLGTHAAWTEEVVAGICRLVSEKVA